MKLQKDDDGADVQMNVVVPKDVRTEFREACDFARVSQRQQIIWCMEDFIYKTRLEREKL